MRDLIRRILKEESIELDMMHYWKNAPKVTDMTDQNQMDDFMWYLIDYVDFPSDGNYRRINPFIKGLINYGLIDIDFYKKMYVWLRRKVNEIYSIENDFDLSLDYVGGDDSFNDWTWHVLSLGKEYFERLKEGYDDAIESVESIRPIESFSYAWPHPYDFGD